MRTLRLFIFSNTNALHEYEKRSLLSFQTTYTTFQKLARPLPYNECIMKNKISTDSTDYTESHVGTVRLKLISLAAILLIINNTESSATVLEDLRLLRIKSAAEASRIVRSRVAYRPDRSSRDSWKAPAVTWREKAGDCEDYARLIHHLCSINNIKSQIVIAEGQHGRSGHAVVTGINRNNRYWVSSNGGYREFSSLLEAEHYIQKVSGLQRPRIYALDNTDGFPCDTASLSIDFCAITGETFSGLETFVQPEGFSDVSSFVDGIE